MRLMQSTRSFNSGQVKVSMNTDKIEDMQRALGIHYTVQVGILGEKAHGRKETVDKGSCGHKKGKQEFHFTIRCCFIMLIKVFVRLYVH